MAAMLLYTLRGTPTRYDGNEVGMEGLDIPAEHAVDPQGRPTGRHRDPARTPMQWSSGENAGFTAGNPWLPVAADYSDANVEHQRDDPTSTLTLYRRLIELRRNELALFRGIYRRRG